MAPTHFFSALFVGVLLSFLPPCGAPCGAGLYRASSGSCVLCRLSCPNGYYQSSGCDGVVDYVCTACSQRCPVGYYIAPSSVAACDGTTNYDTVAAGCTACVTDCGSGRYLTGSCPGTTTTQPICSVCSAIACPEGKYLGGCQGFSDSECIAYPTCPAGQYLFGSTQASPGACLRCTDCAAIGVQQISPCWSRGDSYCGGTACSASKPCQNTDTQQLFCHSTGYCGVCPPGFSSDGLVCSPCPRGYTCDRRGAVACVGECPVGMLAVCDGGYVTCGDACNATSPVAGAVVTRGGFSRGNSAECVPYFRCTVGYYMVFYAQGSYACLPCVKDQMSMFTSHSLAWTSNSNPYKNSTGCLVECDRSAFFMDPNYMSCMPLSLDMQQVQPPVIRYRLTEAPSSGTWTFDPITLYFSKEAYVLPFDGLSFVGGPVPYYQAFNFVSTSKAYMKTSLIDLKSMQSSKGFTLSIWFRMHSLSTSGITLVDGTIWSYGSFYGPYYDAFYMRLNVTYKQGDTSCTLKFDSYLDENMAVRCGILECQRVTTPCQSIVTMTGVSLDAWHHFVLVVPPSGTWTIYLDNVQVPSSISPRVPSCPYIDRSFMVGKTFENVPRTFAYLDFDACDFAIFDYAMTYSQVLVMYTFFRGSNPATYYGAFNKFFPCPAGTTSFVNQATSKSMCVPCPDPPMYATLVSGGCEWVCQKGYSVGSQCVISAWTGTMYPLQRAGDVKQGWKMSLSDQAVSMAAVVDSSLVGFPVCSSATSVMDGIQYHVIAPCAESFIVFYVLNGLSRWWPQKTAVLIGGLPGYAEGYRGDALFQESLVITAIPGEARGLLVLDRLNCVLREVVMYPGEFTTRSYLVYGKPGVCYGPGTLNGDGVSFSQWLDSRVLFASNDFVFEMHAPTRTVTQSDVTAVGLSEVVLVNQSCLHLWTSSGTHYAVVPNSVACPVGLTSVPGGLCNTPCVGGYVSLGKCIPCQPWTDCGVGMEYVACTSFAQGYCRACAPLSSGERYGSSGYCDSSLAVWVPPCPAGFRNVSSTLCAACMPYATSDGVTCRCWEGFSVVNGSCVARGLGGATYSWMSQLSASAYKCSPGKYLDGMNPQVCLPCPPSQVGTDGVGCQDCPVLQQPALFSTVCVCTAPALSDHMGGCICPDGSGLNLTSCAPCALNQWGAGGSCFDCPAGEYTPSVGSTSCSPCPANSYRAAGMPSCVACPLGTLALNASVASCLPCSASCSPGTYVQAACDSGLSLCGSCGALPSNARWTNACDYSCGAGFYAVYQGCEPCNTTACIAGQYRVACTSIQDSYCAACQNGTMPVHNARWASGCAWECAPGYAVSAAHYVSFTLYDCLPA